MSRRTRGKVLLLTLVLFVIAVYDQLFDPILGDIWVLVWIVMGLLALLWLYYAVLMRRSAIHVMPKHLRLQGPLYGVNISYGRVYSAAAAQMDQHHHFNQLKGSEQNLLEPLYKQPCLFIELNSFPSTLKRRHLWFPRFLFGSSRPGILCAVEDWMTLSTDIEVARGERHENRSSRRQEDNRSLAMRLLDEDIEFE